MSGLYGIGKVTTLKALNSGATLKLLGEEDVTMAEVVSDATSFISACYSSMYYGSMSEMRYAAWSRKMANTKISSAPKLKSLPPTSEAFTHHVYHAHYQTLIWKSSFANPVQYRWTETEDKKLLPVALPDVSPAPAEVLQMIKCG